MPAPPPDHQTHPLVRIGRESEPTLPHRLLIDDFQRLEVHDRELVFVIAARGDEDVFAVGERKNVKRQVGKRHLLAGRRKWSSRWEGRKPLSVGPGRAGLSSAAAAAASRAAARPVIRKMRCIMAACPRG